MKRKQWILVAVLLLAVVVLAGCGAPMGGVENLETTAPSGPWQTFVVWPLAKALVWLATMLQGFGMPYHWGFAIILFTVIVKLITLPLTISQMRGMNAQRAIQPRVAELQKKYGNDRNRLAEEQMKLYKEAGVNPLSGCLPLLVQMPVLFGLYAALMTISQYLEGSGFFWIPNLAFPSFTQGMGWVTEFFSQGRYLELAAYLVLPVLLMVTQFIMQKYMTPMQPGADGQAKTTQQITLIMTFMFGFFTLQVPAGLTLYWVTSNLLQMGQQWFMMRNAPALAPATGVVDSTATPVATTPAAPNKASKPARSGQGAKAEIAKPTIVKPSTIQSTSAKSSGKRKGGK